MSRNGGYRNEDENLDDEPLSYGEFIPKLEVEDTDGRPVALTVALTRRQNMAPENSKRRDVKVILRFAPVFEPPADWSGDDDSGRAREYVVNSTSYKTLCAKYGTDEKRWAGKLVVMVPTTNTFNGKRFTKMHVGMPNEWDAVVAATERAQRAAREPAPAARGKRAAKAE